MRICIFVNPLLVVHISPYLYRSTSVFYYEAFTAEASTHEYNLKTLRNIGPDDRQPFHDIADPDDPESARNCRKDLNSPRTMREIRWTGSAVYSIMSSAPNLPAVISLAERRRPHGGRRTIGDGYFGVGIVNIELPDATSTRKVGHYVERWG